MNALDAAIGNANTNYQISNPTLPPVDYAANQPIIEYNSEPRTHIKTYEERMRDAYELNPPTPKLLPYDTTNEIFRLTTMVEEIRATIKAASEEPPTTKHRSLSQWSFDDLLTELIERENDLNPFYFELLKRIQNPDILSQVDGCMNAKMYCSKTLALICSSMNSAPIE